MNVRGARAPNHCQTQEIHRLILKILFKHSENNKCVNARGARADNHYETQGIHRFTTTMLPKHLENYKCVTALGRKARIVPKHKNTQVYCEKVTQTFGKTINV